MYTRGKGIRAAGNELERQREFYSPSLGDLIIDLASDNSQESQISGSTVGRPNKEQKPYNNLLKGE